MQFQGLKSLLKSTNTGLFSQLSKRTFSSNSTFYAKDLEVNLTKNPKPLPPFDSSLKFGHVSTDHLFEVDWDATHGWGKPRVGPYRKFEIDPLNSTLHYAIECFEGMKAFYGVDGKVRLFRPERNVARLKTSCVRIALPDFDGEEFLECIKKTVMIDKRWIPQIPDFSLYIRPTAISMTDALGVRTPEKTKLYIVCTPVGPYFSGGFKPIKLYTEKNFIRAFPGGYGSYKVGANYGPTIMISREAEKKGYQQILWLTNNQITEVGASNIFFLMYNDKGEKELVTAPIDGISLPGVTRDSVLDLAREMGEFKVSERYLHINEFIAAVKDKKIIEVFGAGTAATLAPVEVIHYDDVDYHIPVNPKTQAGDLTLLLSQKIKDIQYGVIPHKWCPIIG